MSESLDAETQGSGPQPGKGPDATLVSSSAGEVPTQSSLNPQEGTSSGEAKVPGPGSTVVDVGGQLGPYKLVDKLGEGGMGAVYKARHEHLDKTVAIKVLPQEITRHPDSIARFKREMKAVGKIDHPNIVRAMDAGEVSGVHYLAMEYVEGTDLSQLIKDRGPIPVVQACKAIRQAALALAAAHGVGLIHRDIKPANLLLARNGQIKLLDLGLALLGDDAVEHTELTTAGQTFGTPDYMAPEQWKDAHAADARTDLYALGCTLYYLLVGHAPYGTAKYSNAVVKMSAHVLEPIPDFPPHRTEIPEAVRAIYRKLLAKSPEERFQTAAELAEALAPFSSGRRLATGDPRPDSKHNAPTHAADAASVPAPASGGRQPAGAPTAPATNPFPVPSRPGPQTEDDQPTLTDPKPVSHAARVTEPPPTMQASRVQHGEPGPPRNPRRKLFYAAGAAFLVLCGVIIITITNKDGTQTKIEVPDDSKVEITASSQSPLVPPGRGGGAEGRTATGWHGWPAEAPPPAIAPFNTEQAKHHQEAWAKYLGVPVEYTNSLGMKFRLIPPGEFRMGGTQEEIDEALKLVGENEYWQVCIKSEGPRHQVILTRPIYLGVKEVTQGEYEKVMGTNPSFFARTGPEKQYVEKVEGLDTFAHPVEGVSWNDAAEFCGKLSQQEKMTPFYFRAGETITSLDGTGYKLPTEAEWEFSCRAGTTSRFWIGDKDEDLINAGWSGANSGGRTHAAGELKANPFGMFDIHGNVYEWVQDAWDPTSYGQFQEKLAVDPNTPSSAGTDRVIRGGDCINLAFHCRSSDRHSFGPTARFFHIGFRVSLPVEAVRQALKVTGPAMPKPVTTTPSAPAGEAEKLPAKFTNRLGMEFVLVGQGTAWLGGGNGQQGEKKVEMPEDFYLGRYEVTQAEWEQVTGLTPSYFSRTGAGKDAVKDIPDADLKRFPVEQVSWDDAQLFLERLNKQEPSAGWVYRLPKADEWEYACRGGPLSDKLDSAFDFYFDKPTNQLLPDQANFWPVPGKGLQRTCKVGSYQPNRLGLYDMHGNIFEWCDDNQKAADGVSRHLIRGGGWIDPPEQCRVAYRFSFPPSDRLQHLGLRVARVPVGPAKPKPVATTPSAPALAPIDFAAERQAAEWVLSVGGTVALESERGGPVGLVDGKLPEGSFAVREINLNDIPIVKDEDLAQLQGCRRLRALNLKATSVTGTGFAHLARARMLTALDVTGCKLTNDGLALLAPFTQLRSLLLMYNLDVTDAGFTHLQDLTQLEVLQVPSNGTDIGVHALSRLHRLRELSFADRMTDSGIAQMIVQNPNLEELWIPGGTSIVPVSKALRLRTLRCGGVQLTPDGLRSLQTLPSLESLLLYAPLGNDELTRIAELPNLRQVSLFFFNDDTSGPGDFGFQSLERLKKLEGITIQGNASSPSDGVLIRWSGIPNLKRLFLYHEEAKRRYTPAGIARFRELRPDVHLLIDGKDIPPSSAIPYSAIQKLGETDPLPKWELPAGSPLPVVAPCKPEEATALQQKWAEHLKRPVVEEVAAPAGLGMKFALIPPGEFRKIFTRPRDPAIEPDMPVRRFRITKPYAISTTEVTWDQFRQFVEATGYQTEAETNGVGGRDRSFQSDPKINWRNPGWKPAPNEPVTQVTPRDAAAFCAWLTDPVGWASSPSAPNAGNTKDGEKKKEKTDGLETHPTYRLPTEAEWLHACRAGSVHKHVVGPNPQDLADYAWTQELLDPNPQASPLHLVAQKKPNPFGLHDTLGNVWEYTRDVLSPALVPYLRTNDPVSYGPGNTLGSNYADARQTVHPDWGFVGWNTPQNNQGFRVLKQFAGEPLPGPLDRPLVLRAGQPLSVHALVPRPEKIPGLQSWSIELVGTHTPYTTAIAASPKGDVIATGSIITGKISLWDRDGNYQRALLGHEAVVYAFDFSPDGRWLASCEMGGGTHGFGGITARVWNVETGALHAVIPLPGGGNRISFSPNSEQLAVSIEYFGTFLVFDLATSAVRTPAINGNTVRGLAWSPDGTELACSHVSDNHLRIWDSKTLKVLREVEAPASHSLEWSPNGQWLAMQGSDGKVAMRDAKTLAVTKTFDAALIPSPHALAWLPDSKRLAASAGDQGGVFDTETGERLAKFNAGNSPIALLDEGKQVVFELYGRLVFYDTTTGQKLREGKERGGAGGTTTLVENGNDVFAHANARIRFFSSDIGVLKQSFSIEGTGDWRSHLSPNGTLICATTHWEGIAPLILDSATGKVQRQLTRGQEVITRVAWSPDGKWLATGATDKLVRVWNVATGKIEHELAGHTGTISSLAWSPDGTRLASAAEDKTVRLWNPLAGRLVASYDQLPEAMIIYSWSHSLAWTTDSRRLWIALTNNIVPLDVETGTFGPLENFSNGNVVSFLNMSRDGQRLLAREDSGWTFVRGRDAQDRRLLGQHLGQTAQWHPDSRRFLGWEPGYGTIGFDVETNRRLGILFPWLTGDHWLCIGPTGHYRGSPGVEDQIVYVAMLEDGSQRTYTAAEFAKQFGWKNDPEKAELLGK